MENLDRFPSNREISISNRRTGDNLSKRESPVQSGKIGTYAFLQYINVGNENHLKNNFESHFTVVFFLKSLKVLIVFLSVKELDIFNIKKKILAPVTLVWFLTYSKINKNSH